MPTDPQAIPAGRTRRSNWLRFDRHELAGSFGDIGTDLPLIIGMILAAGLDTAAVLIMFGLAQIVTGLVYGLPMPMQPLKAMAVLVIAQQLDGDVLYGAGLAIGVLMLVLTLTGLLQWLARIIPRCVVRGVQLGLALSLARLALVRYIPADGPWGLVLAATALALFLVLRSNRRVPAALVVIGLGMAYALLFHADLNRIVDGVGLALPTMHMPAPADVWTGLLVLALPQLPLSLSNSIIATRQSLRDLYPNRNVEAKHLGLTYALANLLVPWMGGIPVCHGCGGLVGHHAFGGRTGGSVVIYGGLFLLLGLGFSGAFADIVTLFPLPILGVALLVEAVALLGLSRDVLVASRREAAIAAVVAAVALTAPMGYLWGLLVGGGLNAVAAGRPRPIEAQTA